MVIKQVLPLLLLLIAGCVTAAQRAQQDWIAFRANPEYRRERVIFKERLGEREPCFRIGIAAFTFANPRPTKDCIYTSSGYFSDQNTGNATQHLRQLKVLQTASDGFLIQHEIVKCAIFNGKGRVCYNSDEIAPNVIWVHKTDEEGIVDGAFLDDSASSLALYEYTGPYAYASVLGATKTVHSFRKLSSKVYGDALKDLKVYNPNDELLADLGLWRKLGESLKSRTVGH